MKAAVVQLELRQGDREANLERAERHLELLAADDVRLVVLPQMLPTGLPAGDPLALAEPVEGPTGRVLRDLARRWGLHLVWGMLLREDGEVHDAVLVADPEGEIAACYRRIHLFWREEDITAGTELMVVSLDGLRLGLMLGEDLFYPEMVQALAERGAQALACPLCAASARLNHLALDDFVVCLARAHAWCSVSDVLVASACGRVERDELGERHGLALVGRSALVALSEGRIQALGGGEEGALTARLDAAKVDYFRRLTRRGGAISAPAPQGATV